MSPTDVGREGIAFDSLRLKHSFPPDPPDSSTPSLTKPRPDQTMSILLQDRQVHGTGPEGDPPGRDRGTGAEALLSDPRASTSTAEGRQTLTPPELPLPTRGTRWLSMM